MLREPRQVGIKTIFDLLKQRRSLFTLGLVFTLGTLVSGTTLWIVSSLADGEGPKVDYELVSKNGKTTNATITDIDTQENITINNEHPSILSYKYNNGYTEIEDQYKSLDPDKIDRMNVGDTIEVKYLADSSIITGLEPFDFPFDMFLLFLIPLPIGLVLLTFLWFNVRNEINLYKYGEVRAAEIVSMTPKNGSPISGFGQGVTVHYQYKTTRGQDILGKSFTNDYSILNSKKQGDSTKIFVSTDDESKSCMISKLDQLRNNWRIE